MTPFRFKYEDYITIVTGRKTYFPCGIDSYLCLSLFSFRMRWQNHFVIAHHGCQDSQISRQAKTFSLFQASDSQNNTVHYSAADSLPRSRWLCILFDFSIADQSEKKEESTASQNKTLPFDRHVFPSIEREHIISFRFSYFRRASSSAPL